VIRELTPDDAAACEAVAATLPSFFGDPDGLRDMAKALRTEDGFVFVEDDAVVGFLTMAPSSDQTYELTWLGVRDDRRHRGIGKQLVERCAERAKELGARAICVLTLGPSVHDVGYESTRAFYRAAGFVPLKELQLSTWNNSHALLSVRPL
jgi:N-acetylglutamate synthase-like GNAT family acetyltransferase